MQRSKSGKHKETHTSKNGTHTTKSSAKSNQGGANSAQQIVNINLGDLLKKSKRASPEAYFDDDDDDYQMPQDQIFSHRKKGKAPKKQKLNEAPFNKSKTSQTPPPPDDMSPPPDDMPPPPFNKRKTPPFNKNKSTPNVNQFKETINEYVRTIENLSPSLRTPDIVDVPDNLLTPSTKAEMQQTIQWLQQAIMTARQRTRTTVLPQNQIQPGFQTFVPLEQQLRVSQLQQALVQAQNRLEEQKNTGGGTQTGTQTDSQNQGDKNIQTEHTGPFAVGVGIQDRQQDIVSTQGLERREREIEELNLTIRSSQEVTDNQKREIEKLRLEMQEAKRLNPDDINVQEITNELDQLQQLVVEMQARFNQGDILTPAVLSPESVSTDEAQQEILTKMYDDKLDVASEIQAAKSQEELDKAKERIGQIILEVERYISQTSSSLTQEQYDQLVTEKNKDLNELMQLWKDRKEQVVTSLETSAGRADTDGGTRASLRQFEKKLKKLIQDNLMKGQAFYNATSDQNRYTLWLDLRSQLQSLYEVTQNPLFNQVSPNLRNQVELIFQRINQAEGAEGDIREGSLVLVLPPSDNTSNLPQNTVGRVVRVTDESADKSGTQLLMVKIPGVAEPVPIQRQNLYPSISDQMTQTPQQQSPLPFGALAESAAFSPFLDDDRSPFNASASSPFPDIPADLFETPERPTQGTSTDTAIPNQQVQNPTTPGTSRPSGRRSDDDKDKDKDKIPLPIFRTLKASHKLLLPEERSRANLVKASKLYYTEGPEIAQQYLDQTPSTQGYKIDTELSTDQAIVTTTPESTSTKPIVELAWRGTVFPKFSFGGRSSFTDHASWDDLKADAKIISTGRDDGSMGDSLIDSVREKYGTTPEHTTGYSLGAYRSSKAARKYDIPSTEFNPLIPPGGLKDELTAPQTTLMTTDNITSIPYSWTKRDPKRTMKTFTSMDGDTDPVAVHSLDKQFINRTEETMPLSEEGYLYALRDNTKSRGFTKMVEEFEPSLQQNLSFTEAMDKFNRPSGTNSPHRNVITDPETGAPLLNGAGSQPHTRELRTWIDLGGTLTNNEIDAITNRSWLQNPLDKSSPTPEKAQKFLDSVNQLHEGDELGFNPKERMDYINSSPEERIRTQNQLENKFNKYTDRFEATQSGMLQSSSHLFEQPPSYTQQVRSSLGPGSLGAGLIGSQLGSTFINHFDPQNKLPDSVKVPLVGGAGAFFTALGQRALTWKTVPAGMLGASAQYGTEKLTDYVLDKMNVSKFPEKEISQFFGDVAGGAVSGGVEGGLPGLAVGAGVGAAVGTAQTAADLGKLGLEKLGVKEPEAEVAADTTVGAGVGALLAGPVGALVGGVGGAIYGGIKDLWS